MVRRSHRRRCGCGGGGVTVGVVWGRLPVGVMGYGSWVMAWGKLATPSFLLCEYPHEGTTMRVLTKRRGARPSVIE